VKLLFFPPVSFCVVFFFFCFLSFHFWG
jgi:hypothetical protein